jgi:hypothetical protein
MEWNMDKSQKQALTDLFDYSAAVQVSPKGHPSREPRKSNGRTSEFKVQQGLR